VGAGPLGFAAATTERAGSNRLAVVREYSIDSNEAPLSPAWCDGDRNPRSGAADLSAWRSSAGSDEADPERSTRRFPAEPVRMMRMRKLRKGQSRQLR
jgi:hypothetical protein